MFREVASQARRSTLATGGALSLAAHILLVMMALVPLSRPRPVPLAALDGGPTLLTLDDPDPGPIGAPEPAPAPPSTAAVTAPPQPSRRRPRRPAPLPLPLPAATADPAPLPPAPAAPATGHRAIAPTQLVAHPPAAQPPQPPYVAPGVAASLRTYDNFPRMPDPLRGRGVHYALLADVCVSDRGHVNRVRISAPAEAAPLEHALRDAIRTWRYRPLIANGAPSPFCHRMHMRYQLD